MKCFVRLPLNRLHEVKNSIIRKINYDEHGLLMTGNLNDNYQRMLSPGWLTPLPSLVLKTDSKD